MSWQLKADDKIILAGFEPQGIYRALLEKSIRPVIIFADKSNTEPDQLPQVRVPPNETYVVNYDSVRAAKFAWPERRKYLQNPKYQQFIDEAFRQATSDSFYYRFFTREKGRRDYFLRRWSWLETNNHIYKSLYYFLDLLVENQINKIVFWCVPHEGTFVLFYLLAQVMKIDCIICFQSLFTNRFFLMRNAPFGDFFNPQYLLTPQSLPPLIELPKVEKPFYINKRTSRPAIQLARFKDFFRLFKRTILLTWVTNPKRYKISYRRFWRSLASLPSTRNPKFTSDFDPGKKYVYFPFHLQPEMTTDSLGRQYADQLLVLEKLHAILPDDWIVYCKENPKQRYYMREEDFHQRLSSIPNVVLVHDTCDSFELIRNSQFVATITGTAGWEALRMGKKVLLYGDVWYQSLLGVYKAEQVSTVVDLELDSPVDRESLEQGFDALTRFLHVGCIDRTYRELIKDYDDVINGRLVANSLCGN